MFLEGVLAEGEGFEPPVPFQAQRFSRPPVSTAHPSLRFGGLSSIVRPKGHFRQGLPWSGPGGRRLACGEDFNIWEGAMVLEMRRGDSSRACADKKIANTIEIMAHKAGRGVRTDGNGQANKTRDRAGAGATDQPADAGGVSEPVAGYHLARSEQCTRCSLDPSGDP